MVLFCEHLWWVCFRAICDGFVFILYLPLKWNTKQKEKTSWFDFVSFNLLCFCVWILNPLTQESNLRLKMILVLFSVFLFLFGRFLSSFAILLRCVTFWTFLLILWTILWHRAQCSGSPTNHLVEEDINSVRVRPMALKHKSLAKSCLIS